ncbi:GGDEF domain-containing protein [Deinococcus petrolearius]|uniref:GGDEF domain-containing protein n=1 Tax=Deinococcus petrolearius TaxID=1751295 RepID=A0ABW1DL93_9DEIO
MPLAALAGIALLGHLFPAPVGTVLLTAAFTCGPLLLALRACRRLRDQLAQAEARVRLLDRLVHSDPLTHLHNRRALEQDLDRAVREDAGCWLAVIDVDGLKQINDTLGHAAGDDLLRRFACGFAGAVGPWGRAYRLSGDEFALLTRGEPMAEQVVAEVTREVRQVYREARASVGTARWQAGESGDAWLSRADRAMYRQKQDREVFAVPVRG